MVSVFSVIILVVCASSWWWAWSYRHHAIKHFGNELAQLQAILRVESRKKDEYFAAIEGIVGERDRWRKLYYDEALFHSNAQQLLLRELHRLAAGYQRVTGKRAPLSATVARVISEYEEAHPTADPPEHVPAPKAVATAPTT